MGSDHLGNRRAWDATSDDYQRRHGAQLAINAVQGGLVSSEIGIAAARRCRRPRRARIRLWRAQRSHVTA